MGAFVPLVIRGYGPVKEKAVNDTKARCAKLAADLASPPPAPRQLAASEGRLALLS